MFIDFGNRNTGVLANTTTLVFTDICGIVADVPDDGCGGDAILYNSEWTPFYIDAFCQDNMCVACGSPGDACCPGTSPND